MKLAFLAFLLSVSAIGATETSSHLRRSLQNRDGGRNGDRDGGNRGSGQQEPQTEAGDLGVRFNKIPFPNGAPPGFFPLSERDYPVRGDIADILQEQSLGASIVTTRDFELHGDRPEDYIQKIGGLPSMPNSNPEHPFWKELEEVVDAQLDRLGGVNPTAIMTLPALWEGFNIEQVADAVHDEYPGYWQAELLKNLWAEGVSIDYEILPFRSRLDFIGLQVRLADLNTWAIGIVSAPNFCLKWSAGRARPEEIVHMIARGELMETHGVPENLVVKVRSMGLTSAQSFTAYDEGSPVHPSWPAMHSAASSASLWLAVVLNLTPDQYCEALRVDFAVSYARTVAGVHYPTDNIAGLNLGTEIMHERLADHLSQAYGSDANKVQEKLNRLKFDWADFDPANCSIAGVML